MDGRKAGEHYDITTWGASRRPLDVPKPAEEDRLQRIEDKLDQILASMTKTP